MKFQVIITTQVLKGLNNKLAIKIQVKKILVKVSIFFILFKSCRARY